MDDKVYRELVILEKNTRDMARTVRVLRAALRADERFARLEPVRGMSQPEMFETVKKKGPEDQSSLDPFSVPLEKSRD